MVEGIPDGPVPDDFIIPPEDRPYGLRKRPKTVPKPKDNEFHEDDMSSLSSLSESEPSEHQFAEEEEDDDDDDDDEEEYDDEPVKGKKNKKKQSSSKAATAQAHRRNTMGPPVNTTPLSHLQYSHLTKTHPPRTTSLPPARGHHPYSHSYPTYPPQQRTFALFIAPPTPPPRPALNESLQGQSQTELEGSILRLPTRKHRSALCLTMNRYSSFCCSPAVDIPAFPITATKAALFLSRASDTPIGLSLRVTLPQPVTYPIPIVSQLHKPSPLPPSASSSSSIPGHLPIAGPLPAPPSPERVTKELVQSWSEALAYAQSATRVVWEPVFAKDGVGEKERREAMVPLLNEGCMREVLSCFESAKGMVERGRRGSGGGVGRGQGAPMMKPAAGGSGGSAVANGNGTGGESMGTPPMTGKRSSMDEDSSAAKKKTKWVKGGRSVEAPRKSGSTPPAATPAPAPAAPPAGYTFYVGGPGEDPASHHPQAPNLAPQQRSYATHAPDGTPLTHSNGGSPIFAPSHYTQHHPPHSYSTASTSPLYYTGLQAALPSVYGVNPAGPHAAQHAGPPPPHHQHPYAHQFHTGAAVGPFTYQARVPGDPNLRRDSIAKGLDAIQQSVRSTEAATIDSNGVGGTSNAPNGTGTSKSPQAGTADGSGESEGGPSPQPTKGSPQARSSAGPIASPEAPDSQEVGKKAEKGEEPGKENEAQAIEKGKARASLAESPPPTASSSSSIEHDPSHTAREGSSPRYRPPPQAASPTYAAHGYAQQYWYPTGVQPGYPAPSPYNSNMYAPQAYPGGYSQGPMWQGAAQSYYPPAGYVQPGQYRYDGLPPPSHPGSPTSSSSQSQAHSTDASTTASTSVSTPSAGAHTSSSAHHASTSSSYAHPGHAHAHATNALSNSAYQTHSRDPTLSVDISSLSGANNMYGSPTEYGGSASGSSSYGQWTPLGGLPSASASDIFKR